eukprot:scaffold10758_cov21-Tisochrysis_lutea.AAC.2
MQAAAKSLLAWVTPNAAAGTGMLQSIAKPFLTLILCCVNMMDAWPFPVLWNQLSRDVAQRVLDGAAAGDGAAAAAVHAAKEAAAALEVAIPCTTHCLGCNKALSFAKAPRRGEVAYFYDLRKLVSETGVSNSRPLSTAVCALSCPWCVFLD